MPSDQVAWAERFPVEQAQVVRLAMARGLLS